MTIKPIGDKIVVRPIEVEEKTVSGIVLPNSAQEQPYQGEVIAVGSGTLTPDGTRVALEINVGDQVIYGKFGGTELKLNDEKLIVLSEKDVLVVLGN